MRLVIQRVKRAKVASSGKTVGAIGRGLFVLLGVGQGDKKEYGDILARKLANLRIMADQEGKMNLSVKEIGGEVLVISQFTLYGDASKGNRPSFIKAAPPEVARGLYVSFVEGLREHGLKVKTGSFGDYMEIESVADGPVTVILEHPGGMGEAPTQ